MGGQKCQQDHLVRQLLDASQVIWQAGGWCASGSCQVSNNLLMLLMQGCRRLVSLGKVLVQLVTSLHCRLGSSLWHQTNKE